MLTNLEIRGFRGIDHLQMDGFGRLNLVLGRNNSGKTSVLEALLLLTGATSPGLTITIGNLRGQRTAGVDADTVWRPLFSGMDPTRRIHLRARVGSEANDRSLTVEAELVSPDPEASLAAGIATNLYDQVIRTLRLTYTDADDNDITTKAKLDTKSGRIVAKSFTREDFMRSAYLSARSYSSMDRDAKQFSHLVRIKEEREILDALKTVDERVQRVEVLSESGGTAVYVDLGLPSLIPLAACGDGFVRFFSIIVEVTSCRGGILLVDEIDNGLHYEVMDRLWILLGDLCEKHNVQLFATTHNDEMARSLMRTVGAVDSDTAVFRVDRRENGHSVARYGADMFESVLEQPFEIRG